MSLILGSLLLDGRIKHLYHKFKSCQMRYRDHALTISKSIDLWSNKLAKLKTENF